MIKRLVRWLVRRNHCGLACAISPSLAWYYIGEDMRKEMENRLEAETVCKTADGLRRSPQYGEQGRGDCAAEHDG